MHRLWTKIDDGITFFGATLWSKIGDGQYCFVLRYGSLMFREHFYKHQQWWGDENFKEKTGAEKLQILLKLMKGLQTGTGIVASKLEKTAFLFDW